MKITKPLFQLWSKINPLSKETLKPDLGIRSWNDLSADEKYSIIKHFEQERFFRDPMKLYTILTQLNNSYKSNHYAKEILGHGGPHIENVRSYGSGGYTLKKCCLDTANNDFMLIMSNEYEDVVYELLSFFASSLIDYGYLEIDFSSLDRKEQNEIINESFEKFDRFVRIFNDIFEQFGLNVFLTRGGLVFRQEAKIDHEIYSPVMSFLANPKWEKVSVELSDSIDDYQKGKKYYSTSITKSINALQAFLQLIVNKKTGKGKIKDLIYKAREMDSIPGDDFSFEVFLNIQSTVMKERQTKGDPHPKKAYANEYHARFVLNLIMIFMQHCFMYGKI